MTESDHAPPVPDAPPPTDPPPLAPPPTGAPVDLPPAAPVGPAEDAPVDLAADLPLEAFEPVDLDDAQAAAALDALDAVTLAGLEALLFLADEPLHAVTLADTLELTPAEVDGACQGLAVRHRTERRGTEVRRAAGGWRMYSSALARPVLERWALAGRTGRLTQAALETLAVVAYKQPITRQEIGEIRGVNADGAVRSLVARGFVTEVGRADAPGQAALYGTTTTLLERLGLDSLDDLPPLTDFLPEHHAPDEPELGRIKEARQRLVGGGEQPDPERTREAATRRFGDVRARLAVAGAEAPAPPAGQPDEDEDVLPPPRMTREDRRADEAAMDDLTDRLEDAARSAVHRLRQAVSATEARDAADGGDATDPAAAGDGGGAGEPAGPVGTPDSGDAPAGRDPGEARQDAPDAAQEGDGRG